MTRVQTSNDKDTRSGSLADSIRVNNFDLLRLIAASQVMLGHAVAHLDLEKPAGWSIWEAFPGVPMFFAISGFLIAASYERTSDLFSYARNRALRIYPGLWCCIAATIFVGALVGIDFAHWRAPIWTVSQFAGAIYTPTFLQGFGFGSYNGSLWTIPIELQFYALVPVLYFVLRATKRPSLTLVMIWLFFLAVGVISRFALFDALREPAAEAFEAKLFRYSFLPHFYMFLAGVGLYRVAAHQSAWIVGKGHYWLVGYVAAYYVLPSSSVIAVAQMTLLAVVVLSIAYTRPTLANRILHGNDISYGVYIYHGLLINLFIELGVVGRYGYLGALVLLSFLVGYVSWVAVERPMLRRKKRQG